MKKLKNLWVENRVLLVLFFIVIICIGIILSVFARYFFGSSKSSYGDRLDGISEVEITEEMKSNFLSSMEKDDLITTSSIKTSGKIVYISILFKEGVSLVEAQSRALASLMAFEQNYLDFYDFHFTLKSEATEKSDGFLIMGSKNVNGSGLIWNNNTEVKTEE